MLLLLLCLRFAVLDLLPMVQCCSCSTPAGATCANCVCSRKGIPCANCRLSDACLNPNGHAERARSDVLNVVCPFAGCTAGRAGRPVSMKLAAISRMRQHVNEHCGTGWAPPPVGLVQFASMPPLHQVCYFFELGLRCVQGCGERSAE